MPLENEPDIVNPPAHISKITQCVGGSEVIDQTIPNITINAINSPTASRNFINANILSPSPITINEAINVNGVDQFNCSLANRAFQAKTLIDLEFTQSIFDFNHHKFYGDSQEVILQDYSTPTINEYPLNLQLDELIPNTASVYESAFHYNGSVMYPGVNAIDFFTGDLTGINDNLPPLFPEDLPGYRWILKNEDSNHKDWSLNHSSTPNNDEYLVFSEDHWWIYDFGVNKKIINQVEIQFSQANENRHSHIEISGSNDPNIFNVDPNIENITGDQWVGIDTVWDSLEGENTFKVTRTIENNSLFRWYKLTFKSDGFDNAHGFLMIDEIRLWKKEITYNTPIKMSDFKGLHLLETIHSLGITSVGTQLQLVNTFTYNSGHRMVTGSQQIHLGGTYTQFSYFNFYQEVNSFPSIGVGYGITGINYAENSLHNIILWNRLDPPFGSNNYTVTHFDIAVTNPTNMVSSDINSKGSIQITSDSQTTIMDFIFKSNNFPSITLINNTIILKGLEIKFDGINGHKEIEIQASNSEDNEQKYQVGPHTPISNNNDNEFWVTLFNGESSNTNYGDRTIEFDNSTAYSFYRIIFKGNSYQNPTSPYTFIKIKSLKWISGTEVV